MRGLLKDIFYSFPVQLLILHFRKYQILLIFWAIMGSAVNSGFMKTFGADSLFFVPEYMGSVDALSASLVGIAIGVFFMSWNITTFILHTKRFKFLATTSKPFLKYCMNNSVLPLLFLLFYFIKATQYNLYKELLTVSEQAILTIGFLGGLVLLIAFSFAFFFGADRTILRTIAPVISKPDHFKKAYNPSQPSQSNGFGMKVGYFVTGRLRFKKARPVSHYSDQFLDAIFKRHHFAAMVGVILAFIFLIIGGFFLDVKFFQAPAAASIIIFFAIMVAVIGALTYLLESWSVLFLIGVVLILNVLYQNEIIDPRNKAYGLNYNNKKERPGYNRQSLQNLCTPDKVAKDRANMVDILDNWKKKQASPKPVMVFMNVSGGGLRSATFVMNTLQQLDSITNGKLMQQTFLISGSSGGMLSATYFRELYAKRNHAALLNIHDKGYIDNITQDLLNPIFSSMISRDIFAPAQKFSIGPYHYVKDRGYAFEQKLNENTGGILDKQMKDYEKDEHAANIPMIIYNSVITRDGRKMMIGTQPLSFMMKPVSYLDDKDFSPDAVDFAGFFARQGPGNIRLLTALRMNATFPYILPNVWLPTQPVIDVMDAGIRDNYGQETTLRFIDNFKEWLKANTCGVVILQIRDRLNDYWQHPLETGSITDILIKPATMLQHNWHNFQDYTQADQYSYLTDSTMNNIHRLTFIYVPKKEESGAALNFHLTASEKKDVIASFNTGYNQKVLQHLLEYTR
ncbi:MAG: hypothetical protein ABIN01_23860 [Ferruginibacter sp.]